jgi:hypothetical protein
MRILSSHVKHKSTWVHGPDDTIVFAAETILLSASEINFGTVVQAYSVCSQRFMEAELDIYDLALFARQAYESPESVHSFLNSSYPNWTLSEVYTSTQYYVRFYVLHNNLTNDDLVVVRGSTSQVLQMHLYVEGILSHACANIHGHTQADWIQNLVLWSESILFQSTGVHDFSLSEQNLRNDVCLLAGLLLSVTLSTDAVQAYVYATCKRISTCVGLSRDTWLQLSWRGHSRIRTHCTMSQLNQL